MEIGIQSFVSGAPAPGRVRTLLRRIGRVAPAAQARSSTSELSVLFCGDARMRGLNRRYRRKDRSTDVLAFPGAAPVLGDIVISVPYAGREAKRRREPAVREIDRLLLHGYLHLLGYDHETDQGQMEALEGNLRRRLGLEPRRGARPGRKGTA